MDSTEPTFRSELIALIRKHNRNEGSGATPERLAQVMDATAPPLATMPPPTEPRDESLTEPA